MTGRHGRTVLGIAGLAAVCALAFASCNGCEEEAPPVSASTVPTGERHLVAGIPVGTVEGTVRLAEGDAPPEYASSPFDVPMAGQVPASCSAPHTSDRQPLTLDASRGLAHVAIAAMGDSAHWIGPGEPATHELHIRDCRLDPVTLVATLGDRLRIVNDVDYPFMPELGVGFLQAVLSGEPLDSPLDRAGPRTIECAFAAPCGRAQIFVLHHPVATVTGDAGHFRIENAPADQDLTVVTLHPLLESAQVITRVTEGGTSHVEIVVHRHAEVVEPPPPPRDPSQPIDPGAPTDVYGPHPTEPPASTDPPLPPSGAAHS